jgi:hypothetical protein
LKGTMIVFAAVILPSISCYAQNSSGTVDLGASQRDITTINSASCELLLSLYDEGAHRSEYDGILNILNKLPVTKGEFGHPEANALTSRLKHCQGVVSDPDAKRSYIYARQAVLDFVKNSDGRDTLGVNKVDRQRADAEQRKQAGERAKTEAAVVMDEIQKLSASNDLSETYNEIASLQARIQQFPTDIKPGLLDALQIAILPIDKRRNGILADSRRALLEIQKLPDDEEKLHRLSEVATTVKTVPGSEADTLAGAVETMRAATRLKINESANAPDAATIAETDKLKAATEEERAKQGASEEAAKVASAERDKLKASTAEATQRIAIMVSIFSIAKVCAENNFVYDDNKVGIIKQHIVEAISVAKIPKEQVDSIWTAVQGQLATTPIRESDCAALGSNISAIFGSNVFNGTLEKNPF